MSGHLSRHAPDLEIVPFEASMAPACERILSALPDWFGIPESNAAYLRSLPELTTFVARLRGVEVGFVALAQHFPESAENHVLAVHPDHHRRGIGRAEALVGARLTLAAAPARLADRQERGTGGVAESQMAYASIEIVIAGAVERTGRTHLDAGATIDAALRAAGGLAWREAAWPEGELVLRRRSPLSRTASVHRWRIFDEPAEDWRSFALEHRDVLVFTWSLRRDAD